jgi:hypothetical protein
MAFKLAGGNGAIALLCNTLPTGAILTVAILTFGPAFQPRGQSRVRDPRRTAVVDGRRLYLSQIVGGILGVWVAHAACRDPRGRGGGALALPAAVGVNGTAQAEGLTGGVYFDNR